MAQPNPTAASSRSLTSVPLRILVVEDHEADAHLIVHAIERAGYRVDWERVETAAAMDDALRRGGWQLVLADYSLPAFDAPSALRLMHAAGLDLPFIIVSGTIGESTAVAALKAGAGDFIVKNDLSRLVPAIERELRDALTRAAERESRERAARLEREKLLLLDSTAEGIYGIDVNGRCTFMNRAATVMLQWDGGAVLGRPIEELVHRGHTRADPDGSFVPTRPGRSGDLFWRADGSSFPVEYSYHPIWDEGALRGAVVVFADVSERRRADEALRRHTQELEEFYRLAIGRELRMIELKREVDALSRQLGKTPPYAGENGEPTAAAEAANVQPAGSPT